MHQIIRVLTYGDTEEEAMGQAENVIENLTGDGRPFDYGGFFDEEHATSRWGNLPKISKAESKEGKKLIDEGMQHTKSEFIEAVGKIREVINSYSDEELFEEKVIGVKQQILESLNDKKMDLTMFRYRCYTAGKYQGSDIFLYDNDGEGIRNMEHLNNTLTKYNAGKQVWVVPVDVHY